MGMSDMKIFTVIVAGLVLMAGMAAAAIYFGLKDMMESEEQAIQDSFENSWPVV